MLEVIVGLIGTSLLGVIGWAVTLNSRGAVTEANVESQEKLINVQIVEVLRRLARIESKLNGQ